MSVVASRRLAPADWVETLVSLEPAQLDQEPFGPLVLVVRAPEDDDTGQFIQQISACVQKDASTAAEPPRWPSTGHFPTMQMGETELSDQDQIELLAELSSAPHCICPLRPSRGRDGYLVGRASGVSIQLSDPSVSAEHARIFVTPSGVQMEDLGSKNGTTLGGRRLTEGEQSWLQPMDRITFGRVRAFVSDPRVLRAVLRQDLRTLV